MAEEETKPPFDVEDIKKLTPQEKLELVLSNVISVRGLVVLWVVGTVCFMSIKGLKIEEPLYTLVGLTVGYYFGQNQKQQKT